MFCYRDRGVEIAGHCDIKTYTNQTIQRVERLESTYRLLTAKEVPHIDSLFHQYGTGCPSPTRDYETTWNRSLWLP